MLRAGAQTFVFTFGAMAFNAAASPTTSAPAGRAIGVVGMGDEIVPPPPGSTPVAAPGTGDGTVPQPWDQASKCVFDEISTGISCDRDAQESFQICRIEFHQLIDADTKACQNAGDETDHQTHPEIGRVKLSLLRRWQSSRQSSGTLESDSRPNSLPEQTHHAAQQ